MKKILPAILLILSLKNYSQSLVLTQSAYEPIVGDTNRTYLLDTSAFSSGMMTNLTGSNVVWNYQALTTTSTQVTSAYVSTTAVSSASNYPGSTFVQKQGGLNTFFKSATTPTTQTEFMGLSSSSITLNFTNTAVVAKYPMVYGTTVNDNFSGSFSFSISGTASGNIVTTTDGTGTLNIPGGITFTNVLRVKSVQNMTMTSGIFPVGTLNQTTYSFYSSVTKYPVLSLNYTTLTITGQSPSVTATANGNANYFVVGIKENSAADDAISIYPNPSKDILNLSSTPSLKPSGIEIYTQLGQCVYRNSFGSSINLSNLAAGIYFIEIKTDKGVARKKLIKE